MSFCQNGIRVTVWGWLKIRVRKKRKLVWCQYLSHGSGVSFWKKIETKAPYFLFQKVQSWIYWLQGLYHFYLACQEKSNVPNLIETNKQKTLNKLKKIKSSATAGANAKKKCSQLSCDHWYYPVCETLCILWPLENPKYMGKREK